MIRKFVLTAFVLAVGVASAAEKHRVKFFEPSVFNGTAVKAGEYTLIVDGNKVTLQDGKNLISSEAKVETQDQKYATTSVRYRTVDGKAVVDEIRLGGKQQKIVLQPTVMAGSSNE
jgi:hypothetical protein